MMYLTDRHHIAYAMNSTQFPVLRIDMSKPYSEGSTFYPCGDTCRVEFTSESYGTMHKEGKLYYNEGKFYISGGCTGIHNSFGYRDVMEMYKNANSPILRAEQKVVIVMDNPEAKICSVLVMKIGKRISPFCTEMVELEHLTEDEQKEWKKGFRRWFRR